ncbi:MAG: hypothetical protein H7247_15575 [Polaromonas sp.]|nr:hypothetical protein [Gemmatimonadaceae bacterium]
MTQEVHDNRAQAAPEMAAWIPIVAVSYGTVSTAAVVFLGAGFTSVDHIVHVAGQIIPDAAMGHVTGMAVLMVILTVANLPLARDHSGAFKTSREVATRAGVMLLIGLLLAFPPAQWLTFGRPSPTSAYASDGN